MALVFQKVDSAEKQLYVIVQNGVKLAFSSQSIPLLCVSPKEKK